MVAVVFWQLVGTCNIKPTTDVAVTLVGSIKIQNSSFIIYLFISSSACPEMTNDRRLTPVNRAVIGQIVPQLEDTQMLQVDVYV